MGLIANIPAKGNKERVVVIGGGFAGLELARRLNKKQYQVNFSLYSIR